MKHLHKLLSVTSAALFIAGSALAQNAGTVTNHAFALGKGPGTTGYTSLLCGSAQLAVGQSAADPICRTITGDVTLTAAGVTAIGATKVTSTMLNADVFSTAHTWAGQQTFVAPILGTPASGTLTNATGLPIGTGVSGLGTGVATFLATPTSANLRAAITDEVGTGAAYFVGGALGTPASATLTNATGLPISTGLTGAGTGVLTALGVNVGTAGSVVVNGGALGTPSSGTLTNATGLPLSTGVTGTLPKANGGLGATTLSSALDTEFSSTQGSVLYRNATQWVALAPGSAGQFFTTQGAGANPNWSSGGAGTGTVTSVTAGTGLSASSNPITASGTISLALNNATLQTNLTAPTGTASTTQVMAGFGGTCKLTPVYSGRVQIHFIGGAFSSQASGVALMQARFGTGAAPANGAALTGTAVGQNVGGTSSTVSQVVPFTVGGVITGLTPGTAYWFDIAMASNLGSSTVNYQNMSCTVIEF